MDDYSEFKSEEGPTDARFAALDELISELRDKEKEVGDFAESLKKAQEELRVMVSHTIPVYMDSLGMKEFTNVSGQHVEIVDVVQAGISEANRPLAFKWLEDNGQAGLIKREIIVSFSKDQQAAANALLKDLKARFAAVVEKRAVHPSTLKAFVKGQLAEGKAIPLEPFGVFRGREAKVTEAKKK